MHRPFSIILPVLILTAVISSHRAEAADESELARDEKLLQSQGIAVDGPGLLEFFRKKTPSAADLARIPGLIRQLSDDAFPVREKALKDLIGLEGGAVPELTQALQAPRDLETRRRAERGLEAIKNGPATVTAPAAARLLKQRRPEGAAAVLLDYLPFLSDESVEEEIFNALMVLGVREGKVDPALAGALADKAPLRRAAAALFLGRYGSAEQRAAVRALLADADFRVRFRAAQGLLAAREPGALPALIPLLSEAPLDLACEVEGLLGRAAGDGAPQAALDENKDSRRKCREAWEAWWKANENKINLAKAEIDLSPVDKNQQARQVVTQFLNALIKGDEAGIKRTVVAPFILHNRVINSGDLHKFFTGGGRESFFFTVLNVIRMEDFLKRASNDEKILIAQARFRKAEIRAVSTAMVRNGSVDGYWFFVRVRGGRAWVVGEVEVDETLFSR